MRNPFKKENTWNEKKENTRNEEEDTTLMAESEEDSESKIMASGPISSVQFSSVQSLSHVRLFVTPWPAAGQASLSITNSWSLLKLMSIKSVMPSNHLILCCALLLP